jgi:hypothetical protein
VRLDRKNRSSKSCRCKPVFASTQCSVWCTRAPGPIHISEASAFFPAQRRTRNSPRGYNRTGPMRQMREPGGSAEWLPWNILLWLDSISQQIPRTLARAVLKR